MERSRLKKLVDDILKEDRMTEKELIGILGECLEDGCSADGSFRSLYETAYGKKINKSVADMWVKSMSIPEANSERNNGQKWTSEQTSEVGTKIGADWRMFDKTDFYVTMNMMYSDYYRTAKIFERQNDPLFFANMAKDWLCDDDAPEPSEKLYKYYFNVICCN